MQMTQEIAALRMGATPNVPLSYSHFENGIYYYISTCCVPIFHYGLIASTQPIPPNQLGCGPSTPIEGPEVVVAEIDGTQGTIAETTDPIVGEFERFLGNGNIANKDPGLVRFHNNPVGVQQVELGGNVKFSSTMHSGLLDGRVYRLRSFQVTLLETRRAPASVVLSFYVAVCVSRSGIGRVSQPIISVAASPAAHGVNEGRLMTAVLLGQPLFITNDVS
jgi:hypothetical protein